MPRLTLPEILASPTATYDEAVRFFRGKGIMNETLRRLAADLDKAAIDYTVIGAIALNQHGYQRMTVDIDILLSPEGLQRFHEKCVGRGYRPAFEGAQRKFRAVAANVPLEVVVSGEYPGDGKPKEISFPQPQDAFIIIDGVKTLPLETLIELKIASGLTGAGRLKDLADVQELIRLKRLPASFTDQLAPYVRDKFLELQRDVAVTFENEED
ncbi:MAG TPA: hypothetical protein VGB77_03340 [Abditibacteriaceae bacterium]|jgi:hypothetical protein